MFFLHLPYKTSTNVIMYLFKLYILYSPKQMQFWRAKSNGTSAEIKFSLKKKKVLLKNSVFHFLLLCIVSTVHTIRSNGNKSNRTSVYTNTY